MKNRSKHRKMAREQKFIVMVVMIPCVAFYLIFLIIPIVYSFYLSFYEWSFTKDPSFIGFRNYLRVLFQDRLFWVSLRNTFYYAVVTIPTGMVLALFLAVLINTSIKRLRSFFRTTYFIPVITSLVACAFIWKWLYQPRIGLFNQIARALNLPASMWLQSVSTAMPSIMIMSIWKRVGFIIVLFLAGLQGIPQIFYEAALIDGANRRTLLTSITIPLLMPTIVFVLITGVIGGLQVFSEMYLMGWVNPGGPLNATRTIVLHLYERAFDYYQMGYASATALILFVIIIIFTVIQLRLLRTAWKY